MEKLRPQEGPGRLQGWCGQCLAEGVKGSVAPEEALPADTAPCPGDCCYAETICIADYSRSPGRHCNLVSHNNYLSHPNPITSGKKCRR